MRARFGFYRNPFEVMIPVAVMAVRTRDKESALVKVLFLDLLHVAKSIAPIASFVLVFLHQFFLAISLGVECFEVIDPCLRIWLASFSQRFVESFYIVTCLDFMNVEILYLHGIQTPPSATCDIGLSIFKAPSEIHVQPVDCHSLRFVNGYCPSQT